jgi:hypothetical protein
MAREYGPDHRRGDLRKRGWLAELAACLSPALAGALRQRDTGESDVQAAGGLQHA